LTRVLHSLVGPKVSEVIMRRVKKELHGEIAVEVGEETRTPH